MMKKTLDPNYLLRGWEGLPFGVVNKKTGNVQFCTREQYEELLGYDLVSENQKYRKYPNPYFECVHWAVTGRCNYRCRHCYMSAGSTFLPQFSNEEALYIIDQIASCGIGKVNLTGGEPMVRSDFLDLVDALLDHGILIHRIITNGSLIDKEFLGELKKRKVDTTFQISFDGRGCHDWMRGVPGAEAQFERAARLIRDEGFQLHVTMSVNRRNVHLLRDTVNYVTDLGAVSIRLGDMMDVGDWRDQADFHMDPVSINNAFLDYLPHYFEDGARAALLLGSLLTYEPYWREGEKLTLNLEHHCAVEGESRRLTCPHIRNTLCIDHTGRLLPCINMAGSDLPCRFPNVLDQGLASAIADPVFHHAQYLNVREMMDHNPECASCRYRGDCLGGCRALAMEDGVTDYLAPDRYSCTLYQNGFMEKTRDDVVQGIVSLKN